MRTEAQAMNPRVARRLAHFNRRFTNHVARPLAMLLPGFGVVVHTGRRSGREYRTPVNGEARRAVPRIVRWLLRRLGVAEFMRLEELRE
jgi:hypothetical protein